MAENIIIRTDLDLTEYNKKVSRIKGDIQKLNKEYSNISTESSKETFLDKVIDSSKTALGVFNTVNSMIGTIHNTADTALGAVSKVRNGFEVLKFVTSGNTEAIKEYFNVLTKPDIDPMKTMTKELNTQITELTPLIGGIMALETALNEVTDSLLEISGEVGNIRSAIAKYTGDIGDDLDVLASKVSTLRSTYGAESEEIIKTANSVAKATGESFATTLDSMDRLLGHTAGNASEALDFLNEYSIQLTEAGLNLEQQVTTVLFQSQSGVFNDKLLDLIKESGLRLREMTDASKKALTEAFGEDYTKALEAQIRSGGKSTIDAATEIAGKLTKLQDKVKAQAVVADVFGAAGEDVGSERSAKLLVDLQQQIKTLPKAFSQLEKSAGVTSGRVAKALGEDVADKVKSDISGAEMFSAIIEDSLAAGKDLEFVKGKLMELGVAVSDIDFTNLIRNVKTFVDTTELQQLENQLKTITEQNERRKSEVAASMSKVRIQRQIMEQQEEELWLKIYSFVAPLIGKLNDTLFSFYQSIKDVQTKLSIGIEQFAKKYTMSLMLLIGAIGVFNANLLISTTRFIALTVAQRASSMATAAWTLITNGATVAVRLFNLAIASNPYGAAAAAVLTLASAIFAVGKNYEYAYDRQSAMLDLQERTDEAMSSQKAKIDELFNVLKNVNASEEERKKAAEDVNKQYKAQVGTLDLSKATLKEIEDVQAAITAEVYKTVLLEQQRLRTQELLSEKVKVEYDIIRRLRESSLEVGKTWELTTETMSKFGIPKDATLKGAELVTLFNKLNLELDIQNSKMTQAKNASDAATDSGKNRIEVIQKDLTNLRLAIDAVAHNATGDWVSEVKKDWSEMWGASSLDNLNAIRDELKDLPSLMAELSKEADKGKGKDSKSKPISTIVASADEIKKAFDAANAELDRQKLREINAVNEKVKNREMDEEAGANAIMYIDIRYAKMREALHKKFNTDIETATQARIAAEMARETKYHEDRMELIATNEERELNSRKADFDNRLISEEKYQLDRLNVQIRYEKKRAAELEASSKDPSASNKKVIELQNQLAAELLKINDKVKEGREESAKKAAEFDSKQLEREAVMLNRRGELAREQLSIDEKVNANRIDLQLNSLKIMEDTAKASAAVSLMNESRRFDLESEQLKRNGEVIKFQIDSIQGEVAALRANGYIEEANTLALTEANKRDTLEENRKAILTSEQAHADTVLKINTDLNKNLKSVTEQRIAIIKKYSDSIAEAADSMSSLMDGFVDKFGGSVATDIFKGFAKGAKDAAGEFAKLMDSGALVTTMTEEGIAKVSIASDKAGEVALSAANVVGEAVVGALEAAQEVSTAHIAAIDEQLKNSEANVQNIIDKMNEGGKAAEEYSIAQLEAERERMMALKEERRKEVANQKAMATVELAIKAALAIANAFNAPFPLNIIMPAVVAAGFFASVALMQRQAQTAIAETGGSMTDRGFKPAGSKLISGRSHKLGGELVEMEAGEYVFSRQHSAKFGELFEAIQSDKLRNLGDLKGLFVQPNVVKVITGSPHSGAETAQLAGKVDRLADIVDKVVVELQKNKTSVTLDTRGLVLEGMMMVKDEERLRKSGRIR